MISGWVFLFAGIFHSCFPPWPDNLYISGRTIRFLLAINSLNNFPDLTLFNCVRVQFCHP